MLTLIRDTVLVLAPHGGQRRARANALGAVRAHAELASVRAEAAQAVARAAHPAHRAARAQADT